MDDDLPMMFKAKRTQSLGKRSRQKSKQLQGPSATQNIKRSIKPNNMSNLDRALNPLAVERHNPTNRPLDNVKTDINKG